MQESEKKRTTVLSSWATTLQQIRQQRSGPLERKAQIPVPKNKYVKTRHVIAGILPYVRVTSQKQDSVMATNAAQRKIKERW